MLCFKRVGVTPNINQGEYMTIEIKEKICDDCQQQVACVEVKDGKSCGEQLISHLCTDCHINQQDNEEIYER
tara:strand:- start:446 stop:661 length:216 start_codon:yes stop_codon:yes gene_type:complete